MKRPSFKRPGDIHKPRVGWRSGIIPLLGVLLTIPGAWVSWSQATDAGKSRSETERLRDEIKDLVNEQKRANEIAARHADSAAEMVEKAEGQVVVGRMVAGATSDIADAARQDLAQQRDLVALQRRPRLRPRTFDVQTFRVGARTAVVTQWENFGNDPASNVRMSSQFAFGSPDGRPREFPSCSNARATGSFTNGSYTSTYNTPLEQNAYDLLQTGESALLFFGALCYEDEDGGEHKTEFCAVIDKDLRTRSCRVATRAD